MHKNTEMHKLFWTSYVLVRCVTRETQRIHNVLL